MSPNPAGQVLWMTGFGSREEVAFRILGHSGRVMLEGNACPVVPIDISELRAGLFYIEINGPGTHWVDAFIKYE